jgi:hypothetical protein
MWRLRQQGPDLAEALANVSIQFIKAAPTVWKGRLKFPSMILKTPRRVTVVGRPRSVAARIGFLGLGGTASLV